MQSAPAALDSLASQVRRALDEDRAFDDATSQVVVPEEERGAARIVAKQEGVLAGLAYAGEAFSQCCPDGSFSWLAQEGDRVQPGQVIWKGSASARGLLAAERTALNFLQQLSGVATVTAQAVAEAGGDFVVLDTRKTVPGMRDAQKAAVVSGGGINHRRDLKDQLLLKENHFAFSGRSYSETVAVAVAAAQGRAVGAEAQTLDEAHAALAAGATYVMLDNFDPAGLPAAVSSLRMRHPNAVVEVSGGLTPERLAVLRSAGIHRVSLGALTHSAPALDLSMLFDGALS